EGETLGDRPSLDQLGEHRARGDAHPTAKRLEPRLGDGSLRQAEVQDHERAQASMPAWLNGWLPTRAFFMSTNLVSWHGLMPISPFTARSDGDGRQERRTRSSAR